MQYNESRTVLNENSVTLLRSQNDVSAEQSSLYKEVGADLGIEATSSCGNCYNVIFIRIVVLI